MLVKLGHISKILATALMLTNNGLVFSQELLNSLIKIL